MYDVPEYRYEWPNLNSGREVTLSHANGVQTDVIYWRLQPVSICRFSQASFSIVFLSIRKCFGVRIVAGIVRGFDDGMDSHPANVPQSDIICEAMEMV